MLPLVEKRGPCLLSRSLVERRPRPALPNTPITPTPWLSHATQILIYSALTLACHMISQLHLYAFSFIQSSRIKTP